LFCLYRKQNEWMARYGPVWPGVCTQLRTRSECTHRPKLQAPEWVTTRDFLWQNPCHMYKTCSKPTALPYKQLMVVVSELRINRKKKKMINFYCYFILKCLTPHFRNPLTGFCTKINVLTMKICNIQYKYTI